MADDIKVEGGDLYCKPCDVKPNARGVEEHPDGTLCHKRCGQPLDIAETQKPAKKPHKAKASSEAAVPPVTAPPDILGRVLASLTTTFGAAKVTKTSGGHLVEIFIPGA